MRQVKIGNIFKNRCGQVVKITKASDELADVDVIKSSKNLDMEPYNFWMASGSRCDSSLSEIPPHKQSDDDVLIDQVLTKEDYPEYYL